ncbi:hypothetical protein PIB30_027530 [Stylosanthes scabra]|uniref:Uncharacterized protein n=1 Tax=Stylosanthes scabra TaxID=79078 RepID=A0ABU6TAD7_9FABA|nr:hypothetical protein [Stylosanthes scabra]
MFTFDRRSDELSPRRNTPTRVEWRSISVESAVNNLVLKELVEPAVTRPTAQIPVITVVNSCRRALTLASRGVRIAVTDLTPFLPIQSYGVLAAKVTKRALRATPSWVRTHRVHMRSSSYAQISDKRSRLTALGDF